MFGLERAVVFFHHKTGYVPDHGIITRNVFLSLKALVDDKMEIPLQGMSVNT